MGKKMKKFLSGVMASAMVLSLLMANVASAADTGTRTEAAAGVKTEAGTEVTGGADTTGDTNTTGGTNTTEGTDTTEDTNTTEGTDTTGGSNNTADVTDTAGENTTTGEQDTQDGEEDTTPVEKVFAFTDVSEGDWFYSYVKSVFEKGYMTGLNETTFGPSGNLSRAQFATILYRIEGAPEVTFKNIFGDVADGMFYSSSVIWASESGIVTGYDNGNFGPADNLTREQMAVMMYRYAAFKGYDTESTVNDLGIFPDKTRVSKFASTQMQWAVGCGLISGDGGKVNPQGIGNRAQCATVITRFMDQFTPDHTHQYELSETIAATSVSTEVQKYKCSECECTRAISAGETVPANVEIKDVNKNKGTFTVQVTGATAPYEIKRVEVPVWSKSDQSDIVWYTAENQGNGTFVAHADIAKHNYSFGDFKADVYLVNNLEIKTKLGGAKTSIVPVNYIYSQYVSDTKRRVAVINPTVDGEAATKVQFPTWSVEGGQDDIFWYDGSDQGDGVWTAVVNGNNHLHSGTYETHVYATANSNRVNIGKVNYQSNPTPAGRLKNLARLQLDQITNGGMSADDMLYAAFQWSCSIPNPGNIDDNVPAGYTPTQYFGIMGFDEFRGDCYVMTATFVAMAQQLGFDAHMAIGSVATVGGSADHGWAEINKGGSVYVYDLSMGKYEFTYGASGTYQYLSYTLVD